MLTQNGYYIAWTFYLLSATGLVLVFWQMMQFIPWLALKRLLCGLVMVLLYFPGLSYDDQPFWAPGFVITLFEGVVDKSDHWLRVGAPLMTALGVVSVLTLFYSLIRRP